ncbi:MAG: PTS transporter subunit EIIC [Firmicutes bacterium]|uniref:PTS transporter subunit EIIC n=1 Tax=Candidatus Scybalomonas excrementavium TaxID=2840943 RepID=A0A9D9I1A9_9FIRM|nr:PTS transporter subunit EIIC [Candidatus Scybalomonas excrementavium]
MKDKIFGVLQRVGRSFMLPISILPVAGLFLGIGGSFTNQTMLETYGLQGVMGQGTFIYTILSVLNAAGSIVFDNLPIIFAMGVAIGMAKKEKEVAALSSVVAFFIMHASIGALISASGGVENMLSGSTASVVGITSLQMGVFGGIIVGLGVAALHNRFYKIELPQVLSFFGGTRFVPIISAIVYLIVGIVMFYIWPTVQVGINHLGQFVMNSGYAGTWFYGLMERALIPFGLHHVFYLPFWQTSVGGTMEVAGRLVEGAQNIFFAQLADPTTEHFAVSACRFMSGKFPLMIFGLPGAALAMYQCAKPEKKKVVGGLLLSAALTAMITGITEPLEFTFLFVAPVLYVIHCIFAGLAYMFMHIFGVGVGMTFSGGLIDMTLFGIMQGNAKTSWIYIVIVGIGYFVVYYLLFSFLIKKLDLKTPGREDGDGEVKLYKRSDLDAKNGKGANAGQALSEDDMVSAIITEGLGGKSNISDLDCCATRLRVTVKDNAKVKQDVLKSSGASGVVVKGNGVQVIYGPKVTVIKSNLEDYLEHATEEPIHVEAPVQEEPVKEEQKVEEVKSIEISSPFTGKAVELSEVEDGVFSEKMLGDGIAVEPSDGTIYAPFDGSVAAVFDTKHAIGLVSENGLELLIHIGIDTVQLNGQHYDIKVKAGDSIKKGDVLGTVDLESVRLAGYRTITPLIVSNTDKFNSFTTNTGDVKAGDLVLTVK